LTSFENCLTGAHSATLTSSMLAVCRVQMGHDEFIENIAALWLDWKKCRWK